MLAAGSKRLRLRSERPFQSIQNMASLFVGSRPKTDHPHLLRFKILVVGVG